jgi:hypothetical protein
MTFALATVLAFAETAPAEVWGTLLTFSAVSIVDVELVIEVWTIEVIELSHSASASLLERLPPPAVLFERPAEVGQRPQGQQVHTEERLDAG